jgi:oxygen-independent coproporphyrinogen-3 oxidase
MLEAAFQIFKPASEVEITLEANPGTLDRTKLEGFHRAGVNRISLGIQALDDRRLKFLDRIHTAEEAETALRLLQDAGLVRISVDLMLGTPFETKKSWDRELDRLFLYHPEAISLYTLTLEEGTRLARRASQGERMQLSAEASVELLLHLARRLRRNGYRHYEVSNWALPGAECRHNLHYWRRGRYLGLGPSAHSFDGAVRRWNLSDLAEYQQAVTAGVSPPAKDEQLTAEESRVEWVYLQLRQEQGLDLDDYLSQFGPVPVGWTATLQNLEEAGLGVFAKNTFRPNDRGFLLADEIAARLLAVEK